MNIKGVDSLEFKVLVEKVSQEFKEIINDLKEIAYNDKVEKEIVLKNRQFNLSFVTSKHYRLILRSEDFVISLMNNFSNSSYNIKVKLNSKFLWSRGYLNAYEEAIYFIENLIGTSISKEDQVLTSLDFCFDSDEIRFVDSDKRTFVTKALLVDKHYDKQSKSSELTGYDIGNRKGNLFLRIYNKSFELEKSKKYWFKDIWKSKDWKENEDNDVWRVEFQIRKKVLNELRVFTIEDFVNKEKEIWKYLTNDWFKIKSRRNKNNYNSKVKRKWKKVQKSVDLETKEIIIRKPYRSGDVNSHLNQIFGNITSYAAIKNNLNEEEILKEVKKLLHQKQKDKDLTFEEMVKAKIQDRGL